ncbi:DUF777 family protein [Borrelia hispanica]|uniref:DUF777 family protein n=1 Tax=Borrelia hispanica TaxID=40835 RepID=UPI000465837C|nr:DUF777 family protein [Borrelia hispanica]
MQSNYEISRRLGNLSEDLAFEDAKRYLQDNVFICRIGIVKEFDFEKQEGIVVIEEYEDLNIISRNISNLKLELVEGDRVVLLQSSINIFNENDNNYFDKHYFYILNALTLRNVGISVEKFKIDTRELDITSEDSSLNLKNITCDGEHSKISLKSLVIEAGNIELKGNVYINGRLFESHTHSSGTITYINASGAPTLASGSTAGVS